MTFLQQKDQKKKPKNPFMPQVAAKVNILVFHACFLKTLKIHWSHVLLFQNKTTQKKNEDQNIGAGSDVAEVL